MASKTTKRRRTYYLDQEIHDLVNERSDTERTSTNKVLERSVRLYAFLQDRLSAYIQPETEWKVCFIDSDIQDKLLVFLEQPKADKI